LIAEALGVTQSTISRELQRNTGQRGYRPAQADQMACQRCEQRISKKRKMTPETIALIDEKLQTQWSPVQISGWMHRENYPQAVSHETIYQHIWRDKKKGGSLYKELRHDGKKYHQRNKGTAGRGAIPNRVDIGERPSIVEEKARLGDWEGDTIIGTGQSGAIISLVERASKFTILAQVRYKTADAVSCAIVARLRGLRDYVLTMTVDNGKEFAHHEKICHALDTKVYFATPYHSWERGLNEHTNGLVRQYFPKSKRFDEITAEELSEIERRLNDRPRKALNFATPAETFKALSRGSHIAKSPFESSA